MKVTDLWSKIESLVPQDSDQNLEIIRKAKIVTCFFSQKLISQVSISFSKNYIRFYWMIAEDDAYIEVSNLKISFVIMNLGAKFSNEVPFSSTGIINAVEKIENFLGIRKEA